MNKIILKNDNFYPANYKITSSFLNYLCQKHNEKLVRPFQGWAYFALLW